MNLMNLMMNLCKSTLPTYLSLPYHLNTPVRNMSSAHLMLLASFVVRKALDDKEGRALPTIRKVLNCEEGTEL